MVHRVYFKKDNLYFNCGSISFKKIDAFLGPLMAIGVLLLSVFRDFIEVESN